MKGDKKIFMKINKDLIVEDTNYSLKDIPFGVIPNPQISSTTNYFKIGNIMIVWGNRFVKLNWNGNSGEATFQLTNDGTPFANTDYRLVACIAQGASFYASGNYRYTSNTTTTGRMSCWCETAGKPTDPIGMAFIAIGTWK